jgi:uncharacterized protein
MAIKKKALLLYCYKAHAMQKITGREKEINLLQELYESGKPEFLAVYGRRRVGKTFLVRECFNNNFYFHVTGLANAGTVRQLHNFNTTLAKYYPAYKPKQFAQNWFDAFAVFTTYLSDKKVKRKVIFIDELPWFDTAKSDFLSAFEHFWNHWASARKDIMLIICGSSAAWIISKLINNRGGLHNRITQKIKLEPFTLHETEQFLLYKNIKWTHYQIAEAYMAFGGIPYYLNAVRKGISVTQCIDELFYNKNGLLRNEFDNLYPSLFKHAGNYMGVVKALSKKAKGLTREEIIQTAKLPNGGGISKVLNELEQCDFIRKYTLVNNKQKDALYQLTDFYTLFYFNFIEKLNNHSELNWITQLDSPTHRSWSGYAFEQLCLMHVKQIKKALGIAAIHATVSGWRSRNLTQNAQIDLVIDRNDKCINLCEMKFSGKEFIIDKRYAANIQNKTGVFKTETNTKKAVFFTMVTTYGVAKNNYYQQWISNSITLSQLYAI